MLAVHRVYRNSGSTRKRSQPISNTSRDRNTGVKPFSEFGGRGVERARGTCICRQGTDRLFAALTHRPDMAKHSTGRHIRFHYSPKTVLGQDREIQRIPFHLGGRFTEIAAGGIEEIDIRGVAHPVVESVHFEAESAAQSPLAGDSQRIPAGSGRVHSTTVQTSRRAGIEIIRDGDPEFQSGKKTLAPDRQGQKKNQYLAVQPVYYPQRVNRAVS